MPTQEAIGQLADELHRRLHALSEITQRAVPRMAALTSAAERIVGQLAQDDESGSAEACTDVMDALWPTGPPESVGRPDWWRTPLGQLCARHLAPAATGTVSQSVAAAMLGVPVGTVASWAARGQIARDSDTGAVLRSAVLRRAADMPPSNA